MGGPGMDHQAMQAVGVTGNAMKQKSESIKYEGIHDHKIS